MCCSAIEIPDDELDGLTPAHTGNIYGRIAFAPEERNDVPHRFILLQGNTVVASTYDSSGIFRFQDVYVGNYKLAIQYEFNNYVFHYDTLRNVEVFQDSMTFLPITVWKRAILTRIKDIQKLAVPIKALEEIEYSSGAVKGKLTLERTTNLEFMNGKFYLSANNSDSSIIIPLVKDNYFHIESVPPGIYTAIIYASMGHKSYQSERYFDIVILPDETITLTFEGLYDQNAIYNSLADTEAPFELYQN